MTTNHSSLHHFWLILGKFSIFPEPSPSVVAKSIVSSPHKLLRLCSSSKVAHSYVLLPEGLLCLPAQCQECAGNARRQASATSRGCVHCRGGRNSPAVLLSAPLCKEAKKEHRQSPAKMTSSRPLVCLFLPNLSNQTPQGGWGPNVPSLCVNDFNNTI